MFLYKDLDVDCSTLFELKSAVVYKVQVKNKKQSRKKPKFLTRLYIVSFCLNQANCGWLLFISCTRPVMLFFNEKRKIRKPQRLRLDPLTLFSVPGGDLFEFHAF